MKNDLATDVPGDDYEQRVVRTRAIRTDMDQLEEVLAQARRLVHDLRALIPVD